MLELQLHVRLQDLKQWEKSSKRIQSKQKTLRDMIIFRSMQIGINFNVSNDDLSFAFWLTISIHAMRLFSIEAALKWIIFGIARGILIKEMIQSNAEKKEKNSFN